MGIAIPQVVTSDRATGAQVIDGSLKIDSSASSHLRRTPGSAGNRKTFTFSGWVKKYEDTHSTDQSIIVARTDSPTSDGDVFGCRIEDDARISVYDMGNFYVRSGVGRVRDTSSWYHIFFSVDTTVASNNVKLYLNGDLVGQGTYTQNADTRFNSTSTHRIGRREEGSDLFQLNAGLSNYYVIDGQALEPTDFGFTDPLTNTWKPKKYEGDFGTNGFWLPFDGSAPIGQDQSGKGNDWTPVNFGGSMELDNPNVSGARPILNTLPGGTLAGVGVFGSKENKTVTVTVASKTGGGNAYFFDSVERDSLATIRGSTITFDTTDSTNNSHPFKLSSTNADSSSGTEYTDGVAYYINGSTVSGSDYVSNYSTNGGGTGFRGIKWTVPHNVSTTYYYCTVHNGMGEGGRLTSTTDETKADPYAWKNVLALPLVGSKEDVSNQINSGSTAKTISSNGSPASSGEQSNFYGESFQFIESDSDRLDCTIAALGTRDFTLEFWFYTSSTTGYQTLVEYGDHTSNGFYLAVRDGTAIMARSSVNADIANAGGGTPGSLPSGSLINTPTGKYHHIALTRESNTAKIFQNGKYIGSGTWSTNYTPTNLRLAHSIYSAGSAEYLTGFMQDVRLYDGVVKYTGTTVNEQSFVVPSTNPNILPDTPSGVSGGSKLAKIQSTGGSVAFSGGSGGSDISWTGTVAATHTLDYYIFASGGQSAGAGPVFLSDGTDGYQFDFSTGTDDLIRAEKAGGGSDTGYQRLNKGWNHIRVVQQTTSAAMYINGKAAGTFSPAGGVIGSATFYIGTKARLASSVWFRGFICNVRIIEAALTGTDTPVINDNGVIASSEGGTSAIFLWPGVNSLTENTGTDGDTITATADPVLTRFNPFTYTDINIVRGQETGYCTWNPLAVQQSGHGGFRDGNLEIIADTAGSHKATLATFAIPSTGKWYWEVKAYRTGAINNGGGAVGVAEASAVASTAASGTRLGEANSSSWVVSLTDFDARHAGNADYADYLNGGTTENDTAIIGIAVDMDNDKMWMHYGGVYGKAGGVGNPVTGANPAFSGEFSGLEIFPAAGVTVDSGSGFLRANWGQKPFSFPPPDGFQPLNNANTRPVKVISRPDHYVGITTWKGNATSGRIITGLNFNAKPDLIWIKNRGEDVDHTLFDSVRGFGANEELTPNDTYTEGETGVGKPNSDAWGYVNSNNLNGFTVNNGSSGQSLVNNNNIDYVAWCWKAGDTTVANNDGTIATQVRANTEAGFSIVTASVNQASGSLGHGLGATPDMILSKSRTVAYDWNVMNRELGGDEIMRLNTNAAKQTSSNYFNSFNNSTFSVAGGNSANCSGDMVYYCWTNIPGLQKFGVYSGNSNADGTFVELGFRPALLWLKRTDSTGNWVLLDSKRSPHNPVDISAYADTATDANYSPGQDWADIVSNGFKIRATYGEVNVGSYIYAAWAEAPTVDLFGGGANAR